MSDFDAAVIVQALPFLAEGMLTSLLLLALAMAGGIVVGTLIAIVRLGSPLPAAAVAAGYVNGLRSVPLIMVIFWMYLLVPLLIGRPVGAFASARIAFGAAAASGLSRTQAYCYVILPQAFRRMAPVLLTQGIALFQDTSLVYVIGLHDFMTAASIVANREGRLVELYLFAAAVYFALCFAASRGVQAFYKGAPAR